MIQAKCIEKFRNSGGIIIGYRLIDLAGQSLDIESEDLKRAIYNKYITVINLTLTSNGKLVDASEEGSIFDENTVRIFNSKVHTTNIKPISIKPIRKTSRAKVKGEMTLGEKCKIADVPISNVSYYKNKNNCL